MVIITRQQLVDNISNHWKAQYFRQGQWNSQTNINGQSGEQIYKKLVKLGKGATEKQVERIIGNGSWTSLTCHECEREVDKVIRLGEPPNYESSTARICFDCLANAMNLVKEHNATKED